VASALDAMVVVAVASTEREEKEKQWLGVVSLFREVVCNRSI
jgi:hypothetical protein